MELMEVIIIGIFVTLLIKAVLYYGKKSSLKQYFWKRNNSNEAKVRVIKVPDGDGVTVRDLSNNKILHIRLIGIDAPEMNGFQGPQPFAKEAQRHLECLVLHRTVMLTKYGLDLYGRILGNLRVPGIVDNISLEMLNVGLASIYMGKGAEYGGLRQEFYEALHQAKSKKKGLWAQDKVTLPGDYRRMQRNQTTNKQQNLCVVS